MFSRINVLCSHICEKKKLLFLRRWWFGITLYTTKTLYNKRIAVVRLGLNRVLPLMIYPMPLPSSLTIGSFSISP